MSEYQYYEFLAIDRPLTEREMQELRAVSSRAIITATRFTNHYEWGNFKGDPRAWMEKYFDAFLYFANWGTRELMLRLPRRVLDPATATRYCCGETASARIKGPHVILEFQSDDDSGDWPENEEGSLSSLVPLRAEIAGGDLRVLYLGWLLSAQAGELDDDDEEPPCPPGLGRLNAALEAFVTFMRVDRDLLEVAAIGSAAAEEVLPAKDVERWIAGLPEAEKTALLVRLIDGGEPHLRAELVRRFREARTASYPPGAAAERRTVAELLEAAERRAEERRRREAERAARERARQEREAAEARERHLTSLAKREAEAWREVEGLIATKQPGKYDAAVMLLKDLRDLAVRAGRQDEVGARLSRLRDQHAKKPSLIDRLQRAGLVGAGQDNKSTPVRQR